jgi:hypothetical protein
MIRSSRCSRIQGKAKSVGGLQSQEVVDAGARAKRCWLKEVEMK